MSDPDGFTRFARKLRLAVQLMSARAQVQAMASEQREAMIAEQRKSWVRGETGIEEDERKTRHE